MINVILISAALLGQATVIDGDTLRVGAQAVRLWGVDAPEMNTPEGKSVKRRLVEIIEGKQVICTPTGKVSYNRIVATCHVDFKDIGDMLIREGWAKPYCRFAGDYYDKAAIMAGNAPCGPIIPKP